MENKNQAAAGSAPLNLLTGVQELLNAGKALGQAITVNGRDPVILVPEGYKLGTLPAKTLPPLPDHIRQKVNLVDAASFVRYVNRFKTPHTQIFAALPNAEGKGAGFTASLDYHEAGTNSEQLKASRTAHVAEYECPLSKEWLTWNGVSGKAQKQGDFVLFIERNAPDVVTPSSAELMELALNFDAKIDVQFQSKVDRVSGGRQLVYKENVESGGGTGAIKVPEILKIRVPVFEDGKTFDLNVRLEWRPQGGELKVTMIVQRPEDAVRAALKELREFIAAETKVEPLSGKALSLGAIKDYEVS